MNRISLRPDLRHLILWASLVIFALALVNTFLAAYRVQQSALLTTTLELNRVYANKVAQATDVFLDGARQLLGAGADELGGRTDLYGQSAKLVVGRLSRVTNTFNSLLVVDRYGTVLATIPPTLGLLGTVLQSDEVRRILGAKAPLTSQPFRAVTGRWVVTISHPIFDADDNYAGALIGTIYLHEQNALHTVLAEHDFTDGSVLYVVDKGGRVLYHPDIAKVGEQVARTPAVLVAQSVKTGSSRVRDEHDTDELAGYSRITSTGWTVIAQRPTAMALDVVEALFLRMFLFSLPIIALCLAGIWWLAQFVSVPLRTLADAAGELGSNQATDQIRGVNGWYFEVEQLRGAMLRAASAVAGRIGRLKRERASDPLTGLLNRRGADEALGEARHQGVPMAVVLLDVDNFKQINDTRGHAAGDEVLRGLADVVRAQVREDDIAARMGGEELAVFVPGVDRADGLGFAERLRAAVQAQLGGVTVSIGVARWPDHGSTMEAVFAQADQAMYDAKRAGKNCVRGAP
ncbi:sensor domain-containing diguanylate cyclase [Bordetella genomosp. 13]|uniref:sensor domain-containing diguanylate cyclase n=1 Tax=Bordetella genomosp. 13 TaxID=463040 RepID=UPI0016434D9E|nr:sensor domain-containing diguanylate cyclase [Bordetella genomosp. 13]